MLVDAPSAFQTTLEAAEARPEHFWHDFVREAARARERVCYAVEAAGRWQGMAGGFLDEDGAAVEVVSVWVDPEYRGRGLAGDVIRPVLAWARDRGAVSARLWVNTENQTAIGVYERLGFAATDEVERFGPGGQRMRRMMTLSFV